MPWLSLKFGDPYIGKLKSHFSIVRIPVLPVLDGRGAVVSANARGGSGFGFCCDAVNAFAALIRQSGQDLPLPVKSRTSSRANGSGGSSEGSSDDDDDDDEDEDDEDGEGSAGGLADEDGVR
mmetsp:Transcript_37631/g.56835  ORF Transcript_37631/g.56835 Transcript_37631/m.56835 type:complete len:122 (+) Transcript_37631:1-366(+)